MHLSLKGSMDRQPLTDRLGDRLLAEYGGAAAAYSLRSLSGDQTKVVRVRRSSDNAEKDFTASEMGAALEDWVGALNDGFVETWYDQSGNGNDATQTVAASQPKIVDAGVLVSGGLDFDGVSDRLVTSNFLSGSNFSAFSVLKCADISTNESQAWHFTDTANEYYGLNFNRNGAGNISFSATTPDSDLGEESYAGSEKLFSTFSGTSNHYYSDGVESILVKVGRHHASAGNAIGSQGSSGRHLNGSIQEIIIYNSDQSSNREAIEANINNHYSIY